MILSGRTPGGEEIASMALLLMVLVLWIGAWRQDRDWTQWFRDRETGRKERREAETGGDRTSPPSGAPRGPWG